MPLIQCPECGQMISDRSERCIHCGYPINAKRPQSAGTNNIQYAASGKDPNRNLKWVVIILGVFVAIIAGILTFVVLMGNGSFSGATQSADTIIVSGTTINLPSTATEAPANSHK